MGEIAWSDSDLQPNGEFPMEVADCRFFEVVFAERWLENRFSVEPRCCGNTTCCGPNQHCVNNRCSASGI